MVRNAPVLTNYRIWLSQELAERKKRNPAYSLRAMAGAMGVSPGFLSKVMAGKRALTMKSAEKIALNLGLAPDERRRLVTSVGREYRLEEDVALDQNRRLLELDVFKSISDWHHYAILSLADVEGSSARPEWIAQRLGIAVRDAAEAMQRLERLGIIEVAGDRFRQIGAPIDTTDDIASAGLRRFHFQNLRKAEASLENDPVEARDFSNMTMAIDPAHLSEAKRIIRRFRHRLSRLLETGRRQRVYALTIQLFPLDKETSDA